LSIFYIFNIRLELGKNSLTGNQPRRSVLLTPAPPARPAPPTEPATPAGRSPGSHGCWNLLGTPQTVHVISTATREQNATAYEKPSAATNEAMRPKDELDAV
jgi:hypothetical protein